ncbi:MAG: LytTR family DNA-binding domain-containing protein [Bacteroidota bacterium]
MKALIIEDEFPAAERLTSLLHKTAPTWELLGVLDSVSSAQEWLVSQPAPDIIFSDIQLSDGLSFEIYATVPIKSPIIFTTAFDQYAIQAFKVKSIDYLLKPIKEGDLRAAIQKYYGMKTDFSPLTVQQQLVDIWKDVPVNHQVTTYKSRFLVKSKSTFKSLTIDQIAYFYTANEIVYTVLKEGKKFPLDYTLDQITEVVDPNLFFRVNRQYLCKLDGIANIHTYFNGRLKLELVPEAPKEVIVSREKAKPLKKWLGGELV